MMDREPCVIMGEANDTLRNTTGSTISREEIDRATSSAVYYLGDIIVDARTRSQCGDALAGNGNYSGPLYYYRWAIDRNLNNVNS